jgi:ABC-type polysaccharide/polyol phosphate export permease
MIPPLPPSRRKIALSLAGLAAIIPSIIIAFNDPYGFWHWLLLLVALGCLLLSRRID